MDCIGLRRHGLVRTGVLELNYWITETNYSRLCRHHPDAKPYLPVPATETRQGPDRLVTSLEGLGVDRCHDAAITACRVSELGASDSDHLPIVFRKWVGLTIDKHIWSKPRHRQRLGNRFASPYGVCCHPVVDLT
jgi:hypothetical protein